MSGGSAGGHLAALLALTPGDPDFQPGFEAADASVDACVPFYGVYDMTAGRGTTGYDEGLLTLLERRVFKRTHRRRPRRLRSRIAPPPGAAPTRRRSSWSTGPTTPSSRWPRPGRSCSALRAVSKSPVLYAELPYTQHAFDVLPSVRSAHAVAAVVRFLEGVRSRRFAVDAANEHLGTPPGVLTAAPGARRPGRPASPGTASRSRPDDDARKGTTHSARHLT